MPKKGLSIRKIARRRLNRVPSTIYREIRRFKRHVTQRPGFFKDN